MADPEVNAQGVDALIARLRSDGVEAGRAEAAEILGKAQAEAETTRTRARTEADRMLAEAQREAEALKRAADDALRTAMRDAVLAMKAEMMERFRRDVRRLVSEATADPEMLRRMILELVGQSRARVGEPEGAQVLLPPEALDAREVRRRAEDLQSGEITGFVKGLARDLLADGVTLLEAADLHGGLRMRLKGDEIELDLSDRAVAELLMRHLQPRFSAVMDGLIR